jgi:hypothetical protein
MEDSPGVLAVAAAVDVAVDAVSVALSGLTILPATNPSVASYEWVGEGRPPPASAPSRLRSSRPSSAFSVSLGLTDVPSLRSAPVSGTGRVSGGGGDGDGWHPSADVHALGKFKSFALVEVAQTEGLCLGLIGNGGKHFCRSNLCRVRRHVNKLKMGCEAGWFIAAKGQVGTKTPSAFVAPFLDSARITEDTLTIMSNLLTQKTTAEWEIFIEVAKAD